MDFHNFFFLLDEVEIAIFQQNYELEVSISMSYICYKNPKMFLFVY